MATSHEPSAGILLPPPLYFLGCLGLGFLIHHFEPTRLVPPTLVLPARVAGVALLALGSLLALSALALFFRAGTSPIPHRPSAALVVRGPYRFTRNPMYVSLAAVHAGIAAAANALWPLLLVVPALALVRYRVIVREERYLRERFGVAYLQYCTRVRRWL